MVKKKGKSKRTSLGDKYKIKRKVIDTHRKRRKQAKQDAASGKVIPKKKDPGIPNSWPFKQDLLSQIQKAKERQEEKLAQAKEKRKGELRTLQAHQHQGGTARTIQELVEQAAADQSAFALTSSVNDTVATAKKTKGESDNNTPAVGQPSRRAYLKELKKVVDTADVVLQVLDARDPVSTRMNAAVENSILSKTDKRMVLVLNKIDLVPKTVVSAWLDALRCSHPTIAIKAGSYGGASNSATAQDTLKSSTPVGMDGLLQLLKNYARTGAGKNKTTIVVGVIGYPNVGKSSIINALKRSRTAVGVSSRPGFTTAMQEVVLDRTVRLLDSPGVVFDDQGAVLLNCVHVDSLEDPIRHVEALLKRCDPETLMMTYNIPRFPSQDVMIFLALVAKSYGRVLKGGIPDKVGAAKSVLKDWNSGKIAYYTPAPEKNTSATKASAQVMSEFSKEFDLSQFDEEVLNSLDNETDELDFVKLNDDVDMDVDSGSAYMAVDE